VRRRSIALLLVTAAVAAGCGGSENKPPDAPSETASGDEGAVKQALTNYAQAIATNDPDMACSYMSAFAQQQAEKEVPGASS
jgi:ABC-type glycerol-3-phosphate transport system substrate-binding protein